MGTSTSRLVETRWEDDRSQAALDFIAAVTEVCLRHGFAIGHEDGHGAFQVYPLPSGPLEPNLKWFEDAHEVRYLDVPEGEKKEPDPSPFQDDRGSPF